MTLEITAASFDELRDLSTDEVVTHSFVRDVPLSGGRTLAIVTLDTHGVPHGGDAEDGSSRTGEEERFFHGWLLVNCHWMLYELAEKLVDFEDYFRRWRFNHVTTVERIIGLKRGTGGTAGVAYLQSTVGKRAFPELWSLRTRV